MTNQLIKPEDLEKAITEALTEYSAEVTKETKAEVQEAAELCRQQISDRAPRNSGKYANSWKTKKAFEDAFDVRYTVYARKYYPLAHLLEFGHDKWIYGHETGGHVQAKPHIRPAVDETERRLVSRIKMRLG